MKNYLRRVYFFLYFLGIDVRKILALRFIGKYLKDRNSFIKKGGKVVKHDMELTGFMESAGESQGHYFHQDLLVANQIFLNSPMRHIDIGSRIDGFVAHVAAFREIEIMDIRDMPKSKHNNITFLRRDLMIKDTSFDEMADSISCLHAIEHFGLGRYGDPINPDGHLIGLDNIIDMLKIDGTLYLSVPISDTPGVHFNSQRTFFPSDVVAWSKKVSLQRFDFVDDTGSINFLADINFLPEIHYGCGIFTFKKEMN